MRTLKNVNNFIQSMGSLLKKSLCIWNCSFRLTICRTVKLFSTENRGAVVGTPASYSGGVEFHSFSGDRPQILYVFNSE
jgi:hypothetical protein